MSHARFCHLYLMAASQQLHHLSLRQEEAHRVVMADVAILDSVVVEEEDVMTTEDRLRTEDLVGEFRQENGGEAKHPQSVNLVMEEEEEEVLVVLADQMAAGMGEAGVVGDPS